MAKKKITTVPELLKDMGMSKKSVKQVTDKIKNTEIARTLSVLRIVKNVSLEEMSKKMNVSKRSLELMEYRNNDKLKLSDITKYAEELGYDLTLNFIPITPKKNKTKESKVLNLTNLFMHKV